MAFLAAHAHAEDPKPLPTTKLAVPLALVAGESCELMIRGVHLDETSAAKFAPPLDALAITIKDKGKSGPPNNLEPAKVGDTHVVLNFTLPADAPAAASFVLVTPHGETPPREVLILPREKLLEEKEPNDGFQEAQPLEFEKSLRGQIHGDRNVDVFSLTAPAGERVTIELIGDRRGSAMDPLVNLYDTSGRVLGTADDSREHRDPSISATMPQSGPLLIVVMEASDSSSHLHHYLLLVRRGE